MIRSKVCIRCSRHRECAVLFIQMQLCHETLRQWLDRQNLTDRSTINPLERLNIFLQIVRGVEFIHSKEIVHHDIKVSCFLVKFHLGCACIVSVKDTNDLLCSQQIYSSVKTAKKFKLETWDCLVVGYMVLTQNLPSRLCFHLLIALSMCRTNPVKSEPNYMLLLSN